MNYNISQNTKHLFIFKATMIKLISTKDEIWTDFCNLDISVSVASFAGHHLWYVVDISITFCAKDQIGYIAKYKTFDYF